MGKRERCFCYCGMSFDRPSELNDHILFWATQAVDLDPIIDSTPIHRENRSHA